MLRDHGKTALIHGGRRISYADLIENVGSFANLIDLMPDERVMILSENRPEWVYALYGAWKRGTIAVPVDFMSTPEEIAYILQDARPKMVFCSKETCDNLRKAINMSEHKPEVVNFDDIALPKPIEKTFHREKEDIALILYTSGTTGHPKGVMLTFKNLFSNIEGVVDTNIAGREDSTLAILPFHHSYPLMVTLLVPLHIGATVVFLDKLTPEDIIDKLKSYRISVLVGVPRLFNLFHRRIMERIEGNLFTHALFKLMERVDFIEIRRKVFSKVHDAFGGNIKYMVSGGAPLDPEVARDLNTLGFTIVEGYGLTETSPIVSFNPPHHIKLGSVGIPIKGVVVKIGEDGEILVKGNNVMKGYWNNPSATSEVIKHGWLYTGDLGEIDEEGYIYIKGRKKEIIVLGSGKNVNPEEVERLILKESDLVKEVGVFDLNGKLHALVYPDLEKAKERGVLNIYETIKWNVIDRVNLKLPEWKRIVGFKLSETELPKTRLGKIRRFMLPEFYKRVGQSRREKETQDSHIFKSKEGASIKEYLERETRKKIHPNDHLELDLGLDSLGKVELLSFLEKSFGVRISEEDLSRYPTVKEIVELVRRTGKRLEEGSVSWKEILASPRSYDLPHIAPIFHLGRILLKAFLRIYNRTQVIGVENLPPKPFILAPNHASYMDAFVLAGSLPTDIAKDTYFLGEDTYFRSLIPKIFGRLAHVITVNINSRLKESLQKSAYALKKGKVVVIFPEGARTRDGNLLPFKKGVAILSRELNVPIVPVALVGTYESFPIHRRCPKPTKIKVVFGKPIYPQERSYEEITEELETRVRDLIRNEKTL